MKNGILDYVLDILYPRDCVCPFCNRESILGANGLCEKCTSTVAYCGKLPSVEGLDGIDAAFLFEGAPRDAVLRLKYSGRTYLAETFAGFMQPAECGFDCIIPVPLHFSRQRKRGYNQSEKLARALSDRLGIPVRTDILIRTKKTHTQQGLSGSARRRNLKNAFGIDQSPAGLRILLVDEVVTTGSTLSACAAELKKNGAIEVHALCACGVPEWER